MRIPDVDSSFLEHKHYKNLLQKYFYISSLFLSMYGMAGLHFRKYVNKKNWSFSMSAFRIYGNTAIRGITL